MNNGDGSYSISISNLPDAFFNNQQLSAYITAQKLNFNDGQQEIFVVIKMTEIFPGFPMFYFLMIVGVAAAVIVSLVTYRQIQRARIPTFVKKVREMCKVIKGRKLISDSLLYPSKDEYIIKRFGDRWEMLDLSLSDIFGLEGKKRKKLTETTESEGGGM
jgi:hypothetical protein